MISLRIMQKHILLLARERDQSIGFSDTVVLIRSVYLKKVSDVIQKALDNVEYIIANTESNVDIAMSTKKRDKYVKQLAEIKSYYQALSHVAMQRIEIDIDDGVKVNYAKFQGIEVGADGEKKQTIYEFDIEEARKILRVHFFEEADESWLNYVCDCRAGKDVQDDYDIVSGPVADDDVYVTLILYERGLLDKEATLKHLKIKKLFNQILFHTEKALKYCKFVKSEKLV